MDFQTLVDSVGMACAVISVEKKETDHWGDIRIEKANSLYKKIMGPAYYDGMLYYELIPQEVLFEDFCFRCAIKKQHLHNYVDTRSMGLWTDATYIPLESDRDNVGYLLFFFEFTKNAETSRMSDVSAQTAPLVIQTCLKLKGSENYYSSMKTVIADIQDITDSFCSCIILIDRQKKEKKVLCSKFRNDCARIEDYDHYLPYELVATWDETIRNSSVIVKDEYDMEELRKKNPRWVESLCSANVKSLILVPLIHNQITMGYLFITNFDTERFVELKEYIELSAYFLSVEVSNNNLFEKLEHMSNTDYLTGVKNRNAMNERVDFFVSGTKTVKAPFGVLFADLNGLKQRNDSLGHEAGDLLLKDAAKTLKKVFGDYEIYRAGGDEFVVIAPEVQKEFFERKVAELKKIASDEGCVSFAIGAHWNQDGKDLRKSMHIADETMYQDKEQYYRRHEKAD